MYHPFALAEDVVDLLAKKPPSEVRELLEQLRVQWRRSGVLVSDRSGGHERRMLARLAPPVPGAIRRLLGDFLTLPLPKARVTEWPEDGGIKAETRVPPTGTWLVGEAEAQRWGLAPEAPVRDLEHVELCMLERYFRSRWLDLFPAIVLKKNQPLKQAIQPFRLLCATAKRLDILDPFAGKEEVIKPKASGLLKCLLALADENYPYIFGVRIIRLYTAKNATVATHSRERVSAQQIVDAWRASAQELVGTSLDTLELHLIDANYLRSELHDRFAAFEESRIGCSSGAALQVGAGFSIFERSVLPKQCSLSSAPIADIRGIIDSIERLKGYEKHEIAIPHEDITGLGNRRRSL